MAYEQASTLSRSIIDKGWNMAGRATSKTSKRTLVAAYTRETLCSARSGGTIQERSSGWPFARGRSAAAGKNQSSKGVRRPRRHNLVNVKRRVGALPSANALLAHSFDSLIL